MQNPGSILLDSTGLGPNTLLATHPQKILKLHNYILTLTENNQIHTLHGDPLQHIQDHIAQTANGNSHSGWVGYVGYEVAKYLEDFQSLNFRPTQLPEIWLGYYPSLEIIPSKAISNLVSSPYEGEVGKSILDSITKENYLNSIQKAQKYIYEGDIYQVNLSHRFTTQSPSDLYQLYQHMRRLSPAPYSAYLNLGEHTILSSSPELFFKIEDGTITTRPIKGTMPRGKTPQEDKDFYQQLNCSEKDRAELLMITDLERNDLGKICDYGTVKVTQLAIIETYSHVHHLVSTIIGKLKKNITPFQTLMALFPGGSITGAPKKRAMEIIQELETVPRELYTGTIGYITDDGSSQWNIAIRTAYTNKNKLHFHAGGAITADSNPNAEWQETLVKAEGLMQAISSML
ncbi:MAG: aminodeoxychorismate synthase component I [Candidatus Margulisbacteria bacterium]|nr:aminodeoxychorismate synthase component I [Candidatus Margulisiibacteriota bacterium]